MESEAGGINVTQPWRSKLILAFGLLPGAYTVRDAPVPTRADPESEGSDADET